MLNSVKTFRRNSIVVEYTFVTISDSDWKVLGRPRLSFIETLLAN